MAAQVPSAGRLILWHGAPGTGKTSALRALARVWSDWCATHFITDPGQFLGQGTAYLLDVLTASPSRRKKPSILWNMVVLEDTGELLTVDAHERTGQALSRLLNVSDGLLGQGMNVITLVTTNEPLGCLQPAVTRPGRCWRAIEFQPLNEKQASARPPRRRSERTTTGSHARAHPVLASA
jgi:ATP-dependent 26S proteasome regulatory subunit